MINRLTRLSNFLHFQQLLKACGNNYFAPIVHILVNFCKGVKIVQFSSEIIFGQLLSTFGEFLLVTLMINGFARSAPQISIN